MIKKKIGQVLGVVALFCFLVGNVGAQEQCTTAAASNILTASGSGQVSVPANTARIDLGVQVDAANASQAQAQAAEAAQNIISALQNLNVSNLQTSSISLVQLPSPSPSPIPISSTSGSTSGSASNQSTPMFRATNRVQFEAPADQAGEAIDAAVAAGANNILSVSLLPNDTDVANAQQEATRLAVSNALSFGRLLLSELGCNASGVGTITLSPLFTPQTASASVSEIAATTPVLGGQVQVTSNVQVTIIHNCPASAIAALNSNSTTTA